MKHYVFGIGTACGTRGRAVANPFRVTCVRCRETPRYLRAVIGLLMIAR